MKGIDASEKLQLNGYRLFFPEEDLSDEISQRLFDLQSELKICVQV
jgi:hypothetical protein